LIAFSSIDVIDDLMRVLCMLTGDNYDKKVKLSSFVNCAWIGSDGTEQYNYNKPYGQDNIIREWGSWYEWEYFRIKGFKKGTVHFEFLDENLWAKFNRKIGELKGFVLPESKPNPKNYDKKTKPRNTSPKNSNFEVLATIKL
jgi:hypothetical protein